MAGMSITDKRKAVIGFSEPYALTSNYFVVAKALKLPEMDGTARLSLSSMGVKDSQSRPVMDDLIQPLKSLSHLARRSITFNGGVALTAYQRLNDELSLKAAPPPSCFQKVQQLLNHMFIFEYGLMIAFLYIGKPSEFSEISVKRFRRNLSFPVLLHENSSRFRWRHGCLSACQ
ncbi:hypothetical protein HGO34_27465 [Agrobacterium vitis]|nr:hypothetical protein [Agrobacterium vitis]